MEAEEWFWKGSWDGGRVGVVLVGVRGEWRDLERALEGEGVGEVVGKEQNDKGWVGRYK